MDKEYEILRLINSDGSITQRQLSEHTGLSLGAVNILIRKMIREGFVKLVKIPSNRVCYMLTSEGIQEKMNKTVFYVKNYYQFIRVVQDKVRKSIEKYPEHSRVYLNISDPTLKDIAEQVVREMRLEMMTYTDSKDVLVITDRRVLPEGLQPTINIKGVIGS